MYAIGMMTMPAGFKYREVFLKGKPRHDRMDAFRIRQSVFKFLHVDNLLVVVALSCL